MFRYVIVVLFNLCYCVEIYAQSDKSNSDSLSLNVGLGTFLTSEDFAPFYLVNNQFGEVDENDDFFVYGRGFYSHSFKNKLILSGSLDFRNEIISQANFNLGFKDWSFTVGRAKEEFGGLSNNLSTGSLGLSQNALPVPMLSIELLEYKNVPFTKGYLKVKGSWSQRWLEEDRYISNAFLHGKSLYGMVDLDHLIGLKISSGIVHFAQYGGVSPEGDKQPSSWSDYWLVFFGQGIPNPNGGTAGESNGLGNHLGLTEITFEKRLGDHTLTLNYQKQFEDRGSMQYISLKDFLIGLEWDLPKSNNLLDKVYVEVIQSKWQSGHGLPDPTVDFPTEEDNMGYEFGERDDYYNNWLYQSGWTYNGMVMGNPLFTTYDRSLNFFDVYPRYEVDVTNNRIWAMSMGVNGALGNSLNYRMLLTYSRNFGTYSGLYEGRFNWGGIATDPNFEYVYLPYKEQFYSMFELGYSNAFNLPNFSLNSRLAFDTGELYNVFGVQISVAYSF